MLLKSKLFYWFHMSLSQSVLVQVLPWYRTYDKPSPEQMMIHYVYVGHHMLIQSRFSTLRPILNGHHFADDIFKRIFFNKNVWISIKISLEFLPKGPTNKIPALFHIMAWRCSGDKPLSEPMMVNLPTHICVTRPQWVNQSHPFVFSWSECFIKQEW